MCDNANWPSLYAVMVALVLFFPDGRLPSRRWRPIAIASGICFAVLQAATLLEPQHYPASYRGLTNPLPVLPSIVRVCLTPFWIGAFASLFVAAWSVRLRFRRATGIERLQLLWLTYAAVLVPLALVVCFFEGLVWNGFGGQATAVAFIGALGAVPAAVAIAVLRYRLFDIELILSRTLIFVLLTASLVGGYLVLFLAFDHAIHLRGVAGVLAAGLVALGFQPLRHLLQRRIERLVYGNRSDPYVAIARLGERLQAAPDPDRVLETIVDDVTRALRLGYCAVSLHRDGRLEVAAERGRGGRSQALELPLTHQGDDIGVLIAEPAPRSELSSSDHRLLEDLARQAGVAVHGVRLMADLQRSRESLVVAREEERLRLRRDLHDGLGPTLAALVFKIGLIRDGMGGDTERTSQLLDELGGATQAAIADIRQLVYGLRPPALDELGLVGAIREQAEYLAASTGLAVVVESEELRNLSPAVEVAAYRIAIEAVTNASRHAGAGRCTITLRLDDRLHLEVDDDGTGLPAAPRAGVGLRSMRERATELSGTFEIDTNPGVGTRIFVSLPVAT